MFIVSFSHHSFSFRKLGYMGLPRKAGNVPAIDKFDADFFGFTDQDAHLLDYQLRTLFEMTYEAIWDAGQFFFHLKQDLTYNCMHLCRFQNP